MKAIAVFMSAAVVAVNAQAADSWAQMFLPQNAGGGGGTGGSARIVSPVPIAVGGGQVANGMPGWLGPKLTGSRFFDFPESQMLNYAYIPTAEIEAGSYIRMWCAKHNNIQKCDLFINVYRCSDCGSDLNAEFIDYLITEKWEPSQCGPKFISDAGEDEHKFMTFRKQIEPDTIVNINFNSDVKLAFITINSNSVACSAFAPAVCETSGYQQCKLINGECVDYWCPTTFKGPCAPPCGRCHNCALKEAAFQ
eukprot:TRINITY_DN163_c1_g1_i1.p1 TRINITY_DN163_c1_g1~~TRINITY_DN163_c1_g1_i1.p1  ORF type:complete len:272 (+),score=63.31 TRINITY_DN163_c1_g1_i1:64-816(+)